MINNRKLGAFAANAELLNETLFFGLDHASDRSRMAITASTGFM